MLTSLTSLNEKFYSFDDDIQKLRLLSNSKSLICPHCHNLVGFRKCRDRINHFYHLAKQSACTIHMTEPETEEHIQGKISLFQHLQQMFPDYQVELECRIKETNQIADVLVSLPSGERWSFEFQHSPLSITKWEDRHHLYKQANIQDFWLFDDDVFGGNIYAQDTFVANVYKATGFFYTYSSKDGILHLSTDPFHNSWFHIPFTEIQIKDKILFHRSIQKVLEQRLEIAKKVQQEHEFKMELYRKEEEKRKKIAKSKERAKALVAVWKKRFLDKIPDDEARIFQRFFTLHYNYFERLLLQPTKGLLWLREQFLLLFRKCVANYKDFQNWKIKKGDYRSLVIKNLTDFDEYINVFFLEKQTKPFLEVIQHHHSQTTIKALVDYCTDCMQPFLRDIKQGKIKVKYLPFGIMECFDEYSGTFYPNKLPAFFESLSKLLTKISKKDGKELDSYIRNITKKRSRK